MEPKLGRGLCAVPRGWKMSHRGVGTPEHPVRMGRKLVGKTPRVSFQAQRRAETGAWEGDGGGGERERETPVYRAAALCRQTFRCMAWGGYQGRETQEECSGPRGAAGDAAGLPGGWEGTPAEAGLPQPGPPGPSFRPCSAPRPGQRSRLSAGRCCPLLGDARRPFWRELLGRDPQDWGLGGGGV